MHWHGVWEIDYKTTTKQYMCILRKHHLAIAKCVLWLHCCGWTKRDLDLIAGPPMVELMAKNTRLGTTSSNQVLLSSEYGSFIVKHAMILLLLWLFPVGSEWSRFPYEVVQGHSSQTSGLGPPYLACHASVLTFGSGCKSNSNEVCTLCETNRSQKSMLCKSPSTWMDFIEATFKTQYFKLINYCCRRQRVLEKLAKKDCLEHSNGCGKANIKSKSLSSAQMKSRHTLFALCTRLLGVVASRLIKLWTRKWLPSDVTDWLGVYGKSSWVWNQLLSVAVQMLAHSNLCR